MPGTSEIWGTAEKEQDMKAEMCVCVCVGQGVTVHTSHVIQICHFVHSAPSCSPLGLAVYKLGECCDSQLLITNRCVLVCAQLWEDGERDCL